jgi:hypothetical protein
MLLVGLAFVTFDFVQLTVFRPHQHSPDAITRFAFWVWIGAYTVEPIGLVVFGGSRGLAEAFVGEVEGFTRRR